MKDKLLKLGRHSFVYGVGNAIGIAGGFVLIPLYTHVLTTGEYGTLEMINRTADILMLIMFMGIRQAFIRFYFDILQIHFPRAWMKPMGFGLRFRVTGRSRICLITSNMRVISLRFPAV